MDDCFDHQITLPLAVCRNIARIRAQPNNGSGALAWKPRLARILGTKAPPAFVVYKTQFIRVMKPCSRALDSRETRPLSKHPKRVAQRPPYGNGTNDSYWPKPALTSADQRGPAYWRCPWSGCRSDACSGTARGTQWKAGRRMISVVLSVASDTDSSTSPP